MEILHKIVPSLRVSRWWAGMFQYYQQIAENKDTKNFLAVMEFFSENTWNLLPVRVRENAHKRVLKCKFSPGKMHKNFIKLYFLEAPLDYIILEVDDVEYEKLRIMKII